MSYQLRKEIDRLKKKLLFLSANVEESVQKAIDSVTNRDAELAESIILFDNEIDSLEVQLEEECLKILALHQPVAIDLRFIVSILKINNDLERIGDLAVNIAQRAIYMAREWSIEIPENIYKMTDDTRIMLRKTLDALVNLDATLAYEVCHMDDIVDDAHRQTYQFVKEHLSENPGNAGLLIDILSISRNLERMADLATNIAEDIIYLLEGKVVRHRLEDQKRKG